MGFVSLVEEVFVIARVRGQHVQVLLSDGSAAGDWPIARDVADYLGEDIPTRTRTRTSRWAISACWPTSA